MIRYVDVNVLELLGKTLVSITGIEENDVIFTTTQGQKYRMFHHNV